MKPQAAFSHLSDLSKYRNQMWEGGGKEALSLQMFESGTSSCQLWAAPNRTQSPWADLIAWV